MNGYAYQNRLSVLSELSKWQTKVMEEGIGDQIWYGSLVTLMFDHIPGPFELKCTIMYDEAARVYRTLVPHVVRNPRRPSSQSILPIWVIAPDYPVKKNQGKRGAVLKDVRINDGLHLNGIMLLRTDTRLPVTPAMHFDARAPWYKEYVRPGFPLRRIDVQTISETPEIAADYSLKTLKSRIPDLDKLLILPKSLPELPPKDRVPADYASRF